MVCEDAPCCGCCGGSVWRAEFRAHEEMLDERFDLDYYEEV